MNLLFPCQGVDEQASPVGGGRAANPGVAALNVLAWYTRNFGQNGAEVFFLVGWQSFSCVLLLSRQPSLAGGMAEVRYGSL